jgi:hypothetical protein
VAGIYFGEETWAELFGIGFPCDKYFGISAMGFRRWAFLRGNFGDGISRRYLGITSSRKNVSLGHPMMLVDSWYSGD